MQLCGWVASREDFELESAAESVRSKVSVRANTRLTDLIRSHSDFVDA